jgi:hypothetical protein
MGTLGFILPPHGLATLSVLSLARFFHLVLYPMHERPGCFQLRGKCYVPGLMRGEALYSDFPLSEVSGELWTMRFKIIKDMPPFTDNISCT